MNHANTKEEVIEAFRVFDKESEYKSSLICISRATHLTWWSAQKITDRGQLTVSEFREILTELGEPMAPSEVSSVSVSILAKCTHFFIHVRSMNLYMKPVVVETL